MSVHLDTVNTDNAKKNPSLHYFPCKIKYNGEAEVAKYFETTMCSSEKEDEKEDLTASFRGRPLNGKLEKVPSRYTGIIVKEQRRPFSEEDDRHMTISHTFDKFHYWNLDKKPSLDDRYSQMLDWIQLSKEVHRPINTEDSQKSIVDN